MDNVDLCTDTKDENTYWIALMMIGVLHTLLKLLLKSFKNNGIK
jgi:hypothetical protein